MINSTSLILLCLLVQFTAFRPLSYREISAYNLKCEKSRVRCPFDRLSLLEVIRRRFSLLQTILEDITFGLVRMYVTPYCFSWKIFILGLALSYTDKLLVFRWVQIVLLL